jgi:hypothetical protein
LAKPLAFEHEVQSEVVAPLANVKEEHEAHFYFIWTNPVGQTHFFPIESHWSPFLQIQD